MNTPAFRDVTFIIMNSEQRFKTVLRPAGRRGVNRGNMCAGTEGPADVRSDNSADRSGSAARGFERITRSEIV